MLRMPLILAGIIAFIASLGSFIPTWLASFLLGLSLTIKSFIIFILPIIIFTLLYRAVSKLAKDAAKLVVIILCSVIASNFIATFLMRIIAFWISDIDININMPDATQELKPFILFSFPSLIPNSTAMLMGIIAGFLNGIGMFKNPLAIDDMFDKIINRLLSIILFLLPIFITGFVIKLKYDGIIMQIIKNYSIIFAIIFTLQFLYITVFYLISERFSKRAMIAMKNMIPALLSGLVTMSSAASMPLTLLAAKKNTKNQNLTSTIIPTTVNIHLIGDCIAIPCLAFAVIKTYGVQQPDWIPYIIFTFFFVINKFSVAAVPGGGIIVMLPILHQYLGFDDNMISLITALYILFDPVITVANIFSNGAFVKIFDNILGKKYNNKPPKH